MIVVRDYHVCGLSGSSGSSGLVGYSLVQPNTRQRPNRPEQPARSHPSPVSRTLHGTWIVPGQRGCPGRLGPGGREERLSQHPVNRALFRTKGKILLPLRGRNQNFTLCILYPQPLSDTATLCPGGV